MQSKKTKKTPYILTLLMLTSMIVPALNWAGIDKIEIGQLGLVNRMHITVNPLLCGRGMPRPYGFLMKHLPGQPTNEIFKSPLPKPPYP